MARMPTRRITVRLPELMAQFVEREVEASGMSMNGFVRDSILLRAAYRAGKRGAYDELVGLVEELVELEREQRP